MNDDMKGEIVLTMSAAALMTAEQGVVDTAMAAEWEGSGCRGGGGCKGGGRILEVDAGLVH